MGGGTPDNRSCDSPLPEKTKRVVAYDCGRCCGDGFDPCDKVLRTGKKAPAPCVECDGDGYFARDGEGLRVRLKNIAWARRDYSDFDFGDVR